MASTQIAARDTNSLTSDESANYLAGLKSLYLTESEREALLAHSNALLGTYALRAGYQVGRA
nr:hypothetical protein [Pseudomonas sp.]